MNRIEDYYYTWNCIKSASKVMKIENSGEEKENNLWTETNTFTVLL
tara:strand:+ start:249 stop:386 length:138 start_codon:yes stop_codon:yes gene_type:complete